MVSSRWLDTKVAHVLLADQCLGVAVSCVVDADVIGVARELLELVESRLDLVLVDVARRYFAQVGLVVHMVAKRRPSCIELSARELLRLWMAADKWELIGKTD